MEATFTANARQAVLVEFLRLDHDNALHTMRCAFPDLAELNVCRSQRTITLQSEESIRTENVLGLRSALFHLAVA